MTSTQAARATGPPSNSAPGRAGDAEAPSGYGGAAPCDPGAKLMEQVKAGDPEAFGQLVELHYGAVVGTVSKMLGDPTEAHDIAQQVFLRVWKSAPRYRPGAKFTTWLFTITRNLVFNETRRRRRKRTLSCDGGLDEFQLGVPDTKTPRPDEQAIDRERWAAIDRAIASLPEKQRRAVVLRRYEDLPYQEIAAALSSSVPSVKSLLFRARADLRAQLRAFFDA